MGGIVLLLAAGGTVAQPTFTIESPWPVRQSFENVNFGLDEATDIATWSDGATNWVYVTGWMTNGAGGKVFGTFRYNADAPGGAVRAGFFPDNYTTETREHKALAMVIDQVTGDVYVTGSSQKSDGTTDSITIKYDFELSRSPDWQPVAPDPMGVRRYNGPANGNDRPSDIILYQQQSGEKRLVITGVSWGGADQEDIVTVAYAAGAGGELWVDRYDGPAHGADLSAELVAARTASQSGGPPGIAVFVSGTSLGSAATGFDAVVLRLDADGTRSASWPDVGQSQYGWGPGVRRYDGPAHGDEEVTGIAAVPLTDATPQPIVVCGATPRDPLFPGDTEWMLWSLDGASGSAWWPDFGYGPGVRTHSGGGVSGARDIAHDAVVQGIPPRLWAAGEVVEVSGIDAGCAVWELAHPGSMVAASAYTLGDATDDVAYRLVLSTAVGTAFVPGWTSDPNSEGSVDYLTLEQTLTESPLALGVTRASTYDGFFMEDKATSLWWSVNLARLFVTGRSHTPLTGGDYLTVRYRP